MRALVVSVVVWVRVPVVVTAMVGAEMAVVSVPMRTVPMMSVVSMGYVPLAMRRFIQAGDAQAASDAAAAPRRGRRGGGGGRGTAEVPAMAGNQMPQVGNHPRFLDAVGGRIDRDSAERHEEEDAADIHRLIWTGTGSCGKQEDRGQQQPSDRGKFHTITSK